MRVIRSIAPTIGIGVTAALLFVMTLFAILTARIVLLKDLSLQSAIVLAEWNGVDLTTNDILLSRYSIDLDGKLSWFSLENELADRMDSFEIALTGLATHPALDWVTPAVATDIEDAVYSWNYTERNLLDAKRTLQEIAVQPEFNEALVSGLLYEFYSQLLTGKLGVSETTLVLNFLNQIGILDTAGAQFSRLIRGVNGQIATEVATNIQRIQILGAVFVLVLALGIGIVVTLVRRARQVENFRLQLDRSKRRSVLEKMIEGDELTAMEQRDLDGLAPGFDVNRLVKLLLVRVVNNQDYRNYTAKADRESTMQEASEELLGHLWSLGFTALAAAWNNQIVLLVHPLPQEDALERPVEDALRELLQKAERVLDWQVTVVLSAWSEPSDLPQCYERTVQATNYYVLVGSKGVHTALDKGGGSPGEYTYPVQVELQLQDAVLAQRMDEAKRLYREIIDHASQFNYAVLRQTVLRTILGIAAALETVGRNNGVDIESQITEFIDSSTTLETLAETDTALFGLLEDCFRVVEEKKSNKNSYLVEQVERMIEEEYADPALGVESIAKAVHRSSAYLGRIFRSAKSESIAEAVNNRRLQRAGELLRNTNLSVNEIAQAVGMTNTSYFYTLFKKTFGTTPKDYRTNADLSLNPTEEAVGS